MRSSSNLWKQCGSQHCLNPWENFVFKKTPQCCELLTPFLAFHEPCVFMDCMYCRKKSFFILFLQKLQLHSLRRTSMMYCIFVTHFWSFKPLQIQNINAIIGRKTVHFCTWVLVLPPLSSFFPPVRNSLCKTSCTFLELLVRAAEDLEISATDKRSLNCGAICCSRGRQEGSSWLLNTDNVSQ